MDELQRLIKNLLMYFSSHSVAKDPKNDGLKIECRFDPELQVWIADVIFAGAIRIKDDEHERQQ